jgi:hypothetical protein
MNSKKSSKNRGRNPELITKIQPNNHSEIRETEPQFQKTACASKGNGRKASGNAESSEINEPA